MQPAHGEVDVEVDEFADDDAPDADVHPVEVLKTVTLFAALMAIVMATALPPADLRLVVLALAGGVVAVAGLTLARWPTSRGDR